MKLYIGNQNYSSWSLRAWLIFAQYDLPVEIEKLKLFSAGFYQALAKQTPTAKVPVLIDGDTHVWDSLAILEYVNEVALGGKAWPAALAERAKARSLACEMHSGFVALRSEMPMNCRAQRRVELSEKAREDVARIDAMWSEQMGLYPDQYLFGEWSIADAMYAPVALRLQTYQIPLSAQAARYQHKLLSSAALKRWLAQASLERDVVGEDEAGQPV